LEHSSHSGGIDITANPLPNFMVHGASIKPGWKKYFSYSLPVVDMDYEKDLALSHDRTTKLSQPAFSNLYFPREKQVKRKDQRLNSQFLDELSELERDIFILLQGRINDVLTGNERCLSSAKWMFGIDQSDTYSFDNCCIVLRARPTIIRVRTHVEFWRKWLIYTAPVLPFLSVMPPDEDKTITVLHAGAGALPVLTAIWRWPSISVDHLKAELMLDEPKLWAYLEHLEEARLINRQPGGNYYYWGRYGKILQSG
jgi:hypothetical protein